MSQLKQLKVVFFDLDDTLYQYHGKQIREIENAVFSSAIPLVPLPDIWAAFEFIKQKEDEYYETSKLNMWDFYDIACRFSRLLKKLKIDDEHLSEKMAQMYWEKGEKTIKAFPDVELVLRELKKKYKLGILTNGLTIQQRKRISSLGFNEYFDYFFTSELTSADKPSKEYFNFVLDAIKYKNYECALVGNDPINDIKGANNAGIVTIWYNYKGLQQRPSSDYIINEFKELLQIL
jgi:putative hydrolase of the HAD superfamily